MNCQEFKHEIHDFFRGQLAPERAAEVQAHMDGCTACQEFLAFAAQLTCRQFIEFLNEYVEGELDPRRRKIFEEHINLCDDCRDYLDSYRKVIAVSALACTGAGSVLPSPLPEELIQAIVAARK